MDDPRIDLDSFGREICRIDAPTEIPELPETEPGSIDPDRERKLCDTIRMLAAREQELINELRRVQEVGLDQRDVEALKEEAVVEMLSGMLYRTPFPIVVHGRRYQARALSLAFDSGLGFNYMGLMAGGARVDRRAATIELMLERVVSEEELKAEREAFERIIGGMKSGGVTVTTFASSIVQASKQFADAQKRIAAALAVKPPNVVPYVPKP